MSNVGGITTSPILTRDYLLLCDERKDEAGARRPCMSAGQNWYVLPPFPDAELEGQAEVEIIPPAKTGRRTLYTVDLGQTIADRLADGETLRQICRSPNMPSERTVRRWAMTESHPFARLYEAARRIGYHSMADEIVEIADDGSNDWMERETRSGAIVRALDTETVLRSRLRVATRQWLLAKALPKVYGRLAEDERSKKSGQSDFEKIWRYISSGEADKMRESARLAQSGDGRDD